MLLMSGSRGKRSSKMKSVIALIVGLMFAGLAAAYADFSLTAPNAMQSYLFSISEPGPFQMVLIGLALILFVGFREHQELIDRKTFEADDPAESGPFSFRRHRAD
jgi:hypothetical protein